MAMTGMTVHANLVVDGGFESGSLGPWGGMRSTVTSDSADVHNGSYAAQLTPVASFLDESVSIVGGETYKLTFWAMAQGPGVLTVGLDSAPSVMLVSPGTASDPAGSLTDYYQQFYCYFTPVTSGDLTFSWNDNNVHSAFIDDVCLNLVSGSPLTAAASIHMGVVAVPEAPTILSAALLLLPLGATLLRILRRSRGSVA